MRCTLVQSAVLRSHVVCLSVCNVGGLWSHRLEFFQKNFTLVSLGCSLFATPTWRVYSKGNTPKLWPKVTHPRVDLSFGDIRSQIAAEWLQIAQQLQWRAYRKLPSLFLMVPSLTPYDLPFRQKWGFHMPPTYANGHLCNGWSDPLHVWF